MHNQRSWSWILACFVLAWSASAAFAQKPQLQVNQVRVGFPAIAQDREEGQGLAQLFKAGAWVPVSIDIGVGKEGLKGTEGLIQVVLESPDPDDVATNYTVTATLRKLPPNDQFTVLTYTKPAAANCALTVTLKMDGQTIGTPFRKEVYGLDGNQGLYLALGSDLQRFGKALQRFDDKEEKQRGPQFEHLAHLDDHLMLPEQWFGYDGVDLVVLTGGNAEFLKRLQGKENQLRREALAQWVLQGGHLVVCLGKNQNLLTALPEFESLLPVIVQGQAQVEKLVLDELVPDRLPPRGKAEITRLEPKRGREVRWLIPREDGGRDRLMAQGPIGFGQVTVVAFDVDLQPFLDWPGQADFWRALVGVAWPRPTAPVDEDATGRPDRGGPEFISQLYNDLENFEEVPVISFGWVALFILIYILIVGPLDYLFLKKVVKRLELTWITFPTVVILVSAIAYFTAYQIKGHDLRVRKLDLVDIDLRNQQAVGRTWFTIFSPRIEHYTIGVEPTWGSAPADNVSPYVLSWLGRFEGDRTRFRGQSLFRRSYDYEADAQGLKGVPIQVWTTKSFTSTWSQPLDPNRPLLTADLRQSPDDPTTLAGSLTWRPTDPAAAGFDLRDGYLIYRGKIHRMVLPNGTAKSVDNLAGGEGASDWARGTFNVQGGVEPLMKAICFFQEADFRRQRGNSGLRRLDQSWRLTYRNEAFFFARLGVRSGPAQEINTSPAGPSRLWLGKLPTPGSTPPELAGVLRQDTYVRFIIPVQPAKK